MLIAKLCNVCEPRAFDVHELSLNFSDSVHAGDKRKTSQQCALAQFIRYHFACLNYSYYSLSCSKRIFQVWLWHVGHTRALSSTRAVRCWARSTVWNEAEWTNCRTQRKTNHLRHIGVFLVLCFKRFKKSGFMMLCVCVVMFYLGRLLMSTHGPCQVQQRGIQATQDVLAKLLDGLTLADGHPILVIDCLPNRCLVWFLWRLMTTVTCDLFTIQDGSTSSTGWWKLSDKCFVWVAEVCRVVCSLCQNAAALVEWGSQSPICQLHGFVFAGWRSNDGKIYGQCDWAIHEQVVGCVRGGWIRQATPVQLYGTRSDSGGFDSGWLFLQDPPIWWTWLLTSSLFLTSFFRDITRMPTFSQGQKTNIFQFFEIRNFENEYGKFAR